MESHGTATPAPDQPTAGEVLDGKLVEFLTNQPEVLSVARISRGSYDALAVKLVDGDTWEYAFNPKDW